MNPDERVHALRRQVAELQGRLNALKEREKRFRRFWKWCKKSQSPALDDYRRYLVMIDRFDLTPEDDE